MQNIKKLVFAIPVMDTFHLLAATLSKEDYYYVLGLKNEFIRNSVISVFSDVGLFIKNYETRFCYEDMKAKTEIHEFYKNLYEYIYRCVNELYGMPEVYTHSYHVSVMNINTKLAIILNPEL